MALKIFTDLVEDIGKLSGTMLPGADKGRIDMLVDDVGFSLIESIEPGQPSAYHLCDFGVLPIEYREGTLQRLLEVNYFWYGPASPTFAYNFDDNHVVLMGIVSLASTTAESLLRTFAKHAGLAKEWRRNYLLVEPGEPLPTPVVPSKRRMFPNISATN